MTIDKTRRQDHVMFGFQRNPDVAGDGRSGVGNVSS